jgi:hypothetical protein
MSEFSRAFDTSLAEKDPKSQAGLYFFVKLLVMILRIVSYCVINE